MEKKSVIVLLLIFVLTINFSTARLTISEVNPVYNLGDKLYITVTLVPSAVEGNFEINLVCGNSSVNLYKVPAESSFAVGEEQKVTTFFNILPKNLENVSGDCLLEALLGAEMAQTKTFSVTNSVLVNVKLDKLEYDPGETISLELDATKANGQTLEGFVDVSGAINFTKAVEKGIVIEKFAMPETTAAGTYTLNLYVYDRKGEEILNSHRTEASFKINQIPKFIQTSVDNNEVNPGDNLTIGAELFDQAGQSMPADISVSLISPDGAEIPLSVESSKFISVPFEFNTTAGVWKIFLSSKGINDEKDFTIKEIQKATFDFVNGTSVLSVTNIGNAPYNQNINVTIGNETQKLELLNILPGEERKFSLNAPEGEYNVVISDGDSQIERKVFLTGNAISIRDFTGIGIFSKYPLVWVFIALILAALAGVALIKYFRRRTYKHDSALDSKKIFPTTKKLSEHSKSHEDGFVSVSSKVGEAESSPVVKGHRANSSILAVKFSSLSENAKEEVDKAVSKAKLRKGVIEWNGNNLTVIFTPIITKDNNNEWSATKIGYDISRDLLNYNKGHSDKVSFGIGINSGDLIGNIENGRFKYTSVGGTILLAKRLAESANNKVLISSETRKKLLKDVKVQKANSISGKEVFEITGIADREANQGKFDDLMKRMSR